MSGSEPFEHSSPEPDERPSSRSAGRPARAPRQRRQPNYRMRRFVALGVLVVIGAVVAVVVVRSALRDDEPAAEFSLADAATNAADARLIDYEVTIFVGDEVITTADGMIDQRTGSTYLRVSSSIGESSDAAAGEAAAAAGTDAATTPAGTGGATTTSTATGSAGGTATSTVGSATSVDGSAGTAVGAGAAATSVAPALADATAGATTVPGTTAAPAGSATTSTLDGPVVPVGPAEMDEATEVARYVDAERQTVYVSSGAFAAAGLSFERPWVRIDLRRLGEGVAVDLDQLAGLAGGDPLDVAPLLGASTEVTAIDGDAEVEGSPVKRYRVVVAGDAVVADAPAIAGQLEQLGAATPDTFTFVVAVDAGNRIRRLTYEVSNGERTVTTDIVVRVPADDATIEFPDDADTIDFGDIVR